MATTVTYKGQTLATVENQTKTLQTAGTWVEDDFTLTDVTQGGGYTADDLLKGQIGGSIDYSGTGLPSRFSALGQDITSVNLPNVTTLKTANPPYNNSLLNNLFGYCTSLISFSAPKATNTVDGLLQGDTALTSVNLDNLVDTGGNMLNGCTSLETIVLPKVNVCYSQCMANCTALTAVDILGGNYLHFSVFINDSKLRTLIIRKSGVCSLNNINNFSNTPFASNGTGGTLYVPQAQISAYQSATNWSTILGYANNQILPIEGSIYETQYADGTVIA